MVKRRLTCEKVSKKNFNHRVDSTLFDCISLDGEVKTYLWKSKQKELLISCEKHADLAHLVERDLAKVEVAGSSPVIRSIIILGAGEHAHGEK